MRLIYVAPFSELLACGGSEPFSISISQFTKLQQPISAFCFEKHLRSDSTLQLGTPVPYPIFCLSDALSQVGLVNLHWFSSVSVGLSVNFEQLDSPSSVIDFMENIYLKDFNSFIFSIYILC